MKLKRPYIINVFCRLKLAILLLVMLLFIKEGYAQKVNLEPIPLRVASQVFSPEEYYIARVIDERKDLNPTAFVVVDLMRGNNLETVNLKGGTIHALEQYILEAYPGNRDLLPVVIRVKDCKIIEKLKDSQTGAVEGDIHLDFTFAIDRDEQLVDLLDFQGGISYQRGFRQVNLLEAFLRRSVNLSMKYFNDWIEKDGANNQKLAKTVRLEISDYKGSNDKDTVFYSPNRPLTWEDFKGRPRFNNYAASIFASIGYASNSKVENGEIVVDLVLKTYMLKSSSWVRIGNDSYGLNHEQRHFDIAKIITERLKNTLQALSLAPHNYERKVSFHYLEAFREMNQMQEEYDRETSNGTNGSAQQRWNDKIDSALEELGVD
ncbi:DUF922 domain-containing protein [Cyclobacterium marinum]|uniref:DUF922 domain-containing protein n=1 Tax=Cyclobacterium marinum TaxID=104 RepID=UPI0011F01283|nr:DUF922 domain-containing protein [Cyclobacterium marinum]MBI0401312.1 hypothetical protein [Cyclobacterium marinum]